MTNFNLEKLRQQDIDVKSAPSKERAEFYRLKNLVLRELHWEHRLRYVCSQEVAKDKILHLYEVEGYWFHSPELFARNVRMLKKPYERVCRGNFYFRIGDKYIA